METRDFIHTLINKRFNYYLLLRLKSLIYKQNFINHISKYRTPKG